MTRTAMRNHLLVIGGVLLVLGLFGTHIGVNYGTWWLLIAVVAVLHAGIFTTLIAWIVRRVRRHLATRTPGPTGPRPPTTPRR